MSSQQTPQIILPHLNWSLTRLKEAIEKEDTEYYRGAALQRFGLTYEVALKAICASAKEQGEACSTDEACFQWVKEKQWVGKDIDWDEMIENYRRIQSPPGDKGMNKVYDGLKEYYALLSSLSESMKLAGNYPTNETTSLKKDN